MYYNIYSIILVNINSIILSAIPAATLGASSSTSVCCKHICRGIVGHGRRRDIGKEKRPRGGRGVARKEWPDGVPFLR